jgi:RNA polymerase sigma factor for flagellar operon FliA
MKKHDKLISENWYLLNAIARKVKKRVQCNISVDELVSAGSDGLWEAAKTFKKSLGFRFATFANHRIRGAMFDWIRVEFGTRKKHRLHFVPLEEQEEIDGYNTKIVVKDNEWHKDPAYFKYEPITVLTHQEIWENALKNSRTNDRKKWRTAIKLIDAYYSSNASMREIATDLQLSESRISQLHNYIISRFAVMISLGIMSEDFHVKNSYYSRSTVEKAMPTCD